MHEARFHRGIAYAELDELALAIDDLTEAIGLEPGNADAYRARGDCHRYREEYDLAIADFNTALGLTRNTHGPTADAGPVTG